MLLLLTLSTLKQMLFSVMSTSNENVVDLDNWLKASQLHAFCPSAIVYCYIEFKLSYLKNLKMFSISVRQLFEPIVL